MSNSVQRFDDMVAEMKHPTFYDTVVASPQWQAWQKVAMYSGCDWDESTECNRLSQKHFQAFIAFVIWISDGYRDIVTMNEEEAEMYHEFLKLMEGDNEGN